MPSGKKILIVGQNYASVINSLAYGLKKNGENVRAVSFESSRSKYNNYDQFYYVAKERKPVTIIHIFFLLTDIIKLVRFAIWSDIVHVYVYPIKNYGLSIQILLIKIFSNINFVTFLGSEVRRPDVTKTFAKYFSEAYKSKDYEYPMESEKFSYSLQQKYYGFHAIIWDIEPYLFRTMFKSIAIVPHASRNGVICNEREASDKLRIVHSPTAPTAKGSNVIIPIMEKLMQQYTFIEFRLLQNASNEQYQQILADADVLVDQIAWGAFGIASQQALEMGKIVFANLSENRKELYGEDCPVINFTVETIEQKLLEIYYNSRLRKSLQRKGKEYYDKTFKPEVVAKKMLQVYEGKFF